jgi:SAM-dependent methyltransferase/glycosyltransferase involved in cell wall biosynthesis
VALVEGQTLSNSVTVVIPVWDDYVRFLPEAVSSVIDDAARVPIVVVDNASETPVPPLPGTSIIRADQRLSAGAIRNLGLEQVDTRYVVVLDADDMLLPGTLEFLTSRLDANPSLAVSVTSIVEGETGRRHRFPRRFVPRLARLHRTFAVLDSVWSLFPIQGCAMLRTEQVREAGGYGDANLGEDWVLAVSLAFRGGVEVNDRLGRYYRATPKSLWRRSRMPQELVASARRVRDRVRSDPAVPFWAKALLPLIAALQFVAIYFVRPVYLLGRKLQPPASKEPLESGQPEGRNVDPSTVAGFGDAWRTFDQSRLPARDLEKQFQQYFDVFPWHELPAEPIGFDLGCGSGRWAGFVAPRVERLHCVDASASAIAVAEANLAEHSNCVFHHASVDSMPLEPHSMDFGYSLGVLHHVPDTEQGIRACVDKLRPNAPFLIYLYYALDQRPRWFRAIWRATDAIRVVLSRLPHPLKLGITSAIGVFVYWPMARLAWGLERLGLDVDGFPLSVYRDRSLYLMRADAYDRFGTRLEQRFTAPEIRGMMEAAGLERVTFSRGSPYWCAVGFKSAKAA